MERDERYRRRCRRLEPEGEAEVPEVGIVADEVEGTYVDFNCEGHHGRGQVKTHRSQSGVPGEEGEEIKSPKRKIIRRIRRDARLRNRSKEHRIRKKRKK